MLRYQERHRQARRAEFLEVARAIVDDEGPDGLTMQRITNAIGSSTGGIYLYFKTKDDLLATLAVEAWSVLTASFQAGLDAFDEVLADRTPADVAALARLLATAAFWSDAEAHRATDVLLARRLLDSDALEGDASRAAAVEAMLDAVQERIDGAAAVGALAMGGGAERARALLVLVHASLRSALAGPHDRPALTNRLLQDLLLGWGAHPDDLGAADIVLAAFRQVHHLAPAPEAAPAA